MKVKIITQLFYPELISTGQSMTELCEALSKKGIQCEVLCGYPTLVDQSSKLPKKETYKNIAIKRVWSTRFPKLNFLGKVANHITFSLSIFFTLIKDSSKTPILTPTNPPFLGIIVALSLLIRPRPFIHVLFDIYPETAVECGVLSRNNILVKLWKTANRWTAKKADKIVVIGRCMETLIKTDLPKQYHEKIVKINVWTDTQFSQKKKSAHNPYIKKWQLEKKFIVLYAGNMGRFHDMQSIITAAKQLKKESDIAFIFVGDGYKKKSLQNFVKKHGLKNCHFHPYVNREDLHHILNMAHVGLVSLLPNFTGLSVPSKTYGLMAASCPIIALLPEKSEIALMLKEHNAGSVIPPNNAKKLAQEIETFKNNPKLAKTYAKQAVSALNTFQISTVVNDYVSLIKCLNKI